MRRKFLVATVVAGIAVTSNAAFACGDKLLALFGRPGFRQMRARASSASILAYARENSAVAGVLRRLDLPSAGKWTGYKLQAVDTPSKLDQALQRGNYDILLVDLSDADSAQEHARTSPSRPTLLPVAPSATKAEVSAAKKKYRGVLKSSGGLDHYVSAIDEALAERVKTASAARSPR